MFVLVSIFSFSPTLMKSGTYQLAQPTSVSVTPAQAEQKRAACSKVQIGTWQMSTKCQTAADGRHGTYMAHTRLLEHPMADKQTPGQQLTVA